MMLRRLAVRAARSCPHRIGTLVPRTAHQSLHSNAACKASRVGGILRRTHVCGHLSDVRTFSVMPEGDLRKRVEAINEKFVEAREEIEYALEEEGTVYFEEEVTMAREIADDALKMWRELIDDLPDDAQRTELQRSMGMKMEQLKAESQLLFDRLVEH
eukprot:INCI12290.1.p1 GENE.INCI12290.1~~INCI12290.1.p1  ORF type:complete len:158 (-),score=37.38 INCI12290.1:577-1050(-)